MAQLRRQKFIFNFNTYNASIGIFLCWLLMTAVNKKNRDFVCAMGKKAVTLPT